MARSSIARIFLFTGLTACIGDRPTVREGPPPLPPTDVTASNDDPTRVVIRWQPPSTIPVSYVVVREGLDIAVVTPPATTYDDVTAPAGQASAPTVTATQGDRPVVEVAWTDSASSAGATQRYAVAAVFASGQRVNSDTSVPGHRTAPTIEGYEISASNGVAWQPVADGAHSTIVEGPTGRAKIEVTAEPVLRRGIVRVSAVAQVTPFTQPFRVRARTNIGPGAASESVEGFAATPSYVPLQWQRSLGDEDSRYADVADLTGSVWGYAAPPDEAHYYRARSVDERIISESSAVRAALPRLTSISSSDTHNCAVTSEKRASCWVGESTGEITPSGQPDIASIAAGSGHTCAIRTDGKLVCWGGTGTEAPPGPSVDTFTAVTAGSQFTCAIRTDGKLVCFGGGAPPAIGQSTATYKAVSSASLTICALRTDGRLECWGHNGSGQAPAGPSTTTYSRIGVGGFRTCGIRTSDNRAECFGSGVTLPTDALSEISSDCGIRVSDGALLCWFGLTAPPAGEFFALSTSQYGSNCALQTSDGHVACWKEGDAPLLLESVQTAVAPANFCVLRKDGTIRCIGGNAQGESTPPPGKFTSIANGTARSCAIAVDGKLSCWGAGGATPVAIASDTFKSIDMRDAYGCGIRTDDMVVCWGTPTGQQQAPPADTKLAMVSAGGCGVQLDGHMICWAKNTTQAPAGPSVEKFTKVDAGPKHTCALRDDGRVVCWGANNFGQAPQAPLPETFIDIAVGTDHTCGVRADGTLKCWGSKVSLPTTAPDPVKAVTARGSATCVLRYDDKIVCAAAPIGAP